MKVVVARKMLPFGNDTRIRALQYELFHGHSLRRRPDGGRRWYWLDDNPKQPQRLMRTGRRWADIFAPSICWVASQRVRDKLAGLPGIEWLPVVFEKVFDMDFVEGDFSWYDGPPRKEPPQLFDDLPEAPALRAGMPSYYEMIVRSNQRCAQEFGVRELQLVDLEDYCGDSQEVGASEAMLKAYPITQQGGIYVFRKDVFETVDPFLNRDYFHVRDVEV